MTEIVGILNVTPDSFSDGGKFNHIESAVKHTENLISEGASVIDIGAESTRPGAELLSAEDEWLRLEKILFPILKSYSSKAKFSLDTRHPAVARKAIDIGIDWINDVSGFANPNMAHACRSAKVVLMHNLGVPADSKVTIPVNENVTEHIKKWAEEKVHYLETNGIKKENIIFDPGIGFGKTREQSLEIVKNIDDFSPLGMPIMVGHSRKSFLTLLTDRPAAERDQETAILSAYLSKKSVSYLRVHNARLNKLAIDIFATV